MQELLKQYSHLMYNKKKNWLRKERQCSIQESSLRIKK